MRGRRFRKLMSARLAIRSFVLAAIIGAAAALLPAMAADKTETKDAADTGSDDYIVAVFVSSQPGTVVQVIEAIKHLTLARAKEINAKGGINGHKVRVKFFDDDEEVEKTIKQVETALADERLIAMFGLWNSTRGAEVVERIGKSGVPMISEMSVNSLFAGYDNIFTLTRAVNDEIRVFKRFVETKYLRPAFVGLEGDLYTEAYEKALKELSDLTFLVSSNWVPNRDDLDDVAAERAIADLIAKDPDVLCLSIGSARGAAFVEKMIEAGLDIPIFVGAGSAERILKVPAAAEYKGEIYQITDGVPYVDNERLAQLSRRSDFAGSDAQFGRDAVGYGVRYGDILAMIVDAARSSETSDIPSLREHIGKVLRSFASGKKVYRGLWQDWSFTAERASAETPLLVWRPANHEKLILAPIQFLNTGSSWEEVPVLYVNLDMVRIFRIDSSDKSFHAEFYFSMTSERNIGIEAIEFTNAYRGQVSNKPLISVRQIHSGNVAAGFDPGLKLYKVAGKFMFQPDLANFPFDQQQFSITFQPVSTASPFFIQPPNPTVLDRDFEIDDWTLLDEYVGSDQDIISTIQNYVSEQKIIPFYKFNYTLLVKRVAVDYYLRVVFPLLFILLVVYFSIFIPDSRFESVVALQVTALLSTIALYLAIPKLDSDTATLSDTIFVSTELVIALMIGLSILRLNTAHRENSRFGVVLAFTQGILFPMLVIGLFGYVLVKSSEGTDLLTNLYNQIQTWKLAGAAGKS